MEWKVFRADVLHSNNSTDTSNVYSLLLYPMAPHPTALSIINKLFSIPIYQNVNIELYHFLYFFFENKLYWAVDWLVWLVMCTFIPSLPEYRKEIKIIIIMILYRFLVYSLDLWPFSSYHIHKPQMSDIKVFLISHHNMYLCCLTISECHQSNFTVHNDHISLITMMNLPITIPFLSHI